MQTKSKLHHLIECNVTSTKYAYTCSFPYLFLHKLKVQINKCTLTIYKRILISVDYFFNSYLREQDGDEYICILCKGNLEENKHCGPQFQTKPLSSDSKSMFEHKNITHKGTEMAVTLKRSLHGTSLGATNFNSFDCVNCRSSFCSKLVELSSHFG